MASRMITKLIAPLARRVRLLARRAVVRLVYDDPKMQELQLSIFSGEVRDTVERWQDYGLTSHPKPGAEALVLALGGSTDHSAVVKVADRRYRLTALAEGEVALHDDKGQAVHLKGGKTVHVYGCNQLVADVAVKATLNTPLVECSGDMVLQGNLLVAGNGAFGGGLTMTGTAGSGNISTSGNVSDGAGSMAEIRTIYNGHDHDENQSVTDEPNQQM